MSNRSRYWCPRWQRTSGTAGGWRYQACSNTAKPAPGANRPRPDLWAALVTAILADPAFRVTDIDLTAQVVQFRLGNIPYDFQLRYAGMGSWLQLDGRTVYIEYFTYKNTTTPIPSADLVGGLYNFIHQTYER